MLDVKFKWNPKDRSIQKTALPAYEHPGDAGLDLIATIDFVIQPGEVVSVPIGWAIELPPGYEGQIRPRSGMARKHGITVLNTPGTIDEGYRDELIVLLINHGKEYYEGKIGDCIAQLVIVPIPRVNPIEVKILRSSKRGMSGFGSTGK